MPYSDRGVAKQLKFVELNFPRNNLDDKDTPKIVSLVDQLQGLDQEIVYLRLVIYVGAGFGLQDVPKERAIRAGVVFDLQADQNSVLDGFGGDASGYEHAYSIELDKYRAQWGAVRSSTLLFPKLGNPFFDVHYMKSISLDGLAKIRISEIQGSQFIEILPVRPFGDLLAKYDAVRRRIPKLKSNEF
ncbi:hypothetical protein [Bradyrhizobium tropiciagri]|uniref:hypothetical protein n=1 Tax=Bradyrhizobium tropiciagri TaxID=312253 RepID=UPI00067B2B51|nr:hypothetical protein [Bradyrhizobium tropiciagri]